MKKIESELYTMFAAQPVEKTLPPALIEAAEKKRKKTKEALARARRLSRFVRSRAGRVAVCGARRIRARQ